MFAYLEGTWIRLSYWYLDELVILLLDVNISPGKCAKFESFHLRQSLSTLSASSCIPSLWRSHVRCHRVVSETYNYNIRERKERETAQITHANKNFKIFSHVVMCTLLTLEQWHNAHDTNWPRGILLLFWFVTKLHRVSIRPWACHNSISRQKQSQHHQQPPVSHPLPIAKPVPSLHSLWTARSFWCSTTISNLIQRGVQVLCCASYSMILAIAQYHTYILYT